jgi:serine/threonine protein kinase
MNEEIAKLNCPNLNTIKDFYIIETGLEVEGEENPNTQVLVLSPITTNLSEIIKYRRENNWAWTAEEFNALASDLANALNALHSANISHNDVRPCNVFYSLANNCYQLSFFANSVKSQQGQPGLAVSQLRTSAYYGAP